MKGPTGRFARAVFAAAIVFVLFTVAGLVMTLLVSSILGTELDFGLPPTLGLLFGLGEGVRAYRRRPRYLSDELR